MKILIADKFEQWGVDQLKSIVEEVQVEPDLKGDDLRNRVAEYRPGILVVRSTKVPADVLDAASSLSLVIRAGSGYDNIDVAHASELGIMVSNCPGMNSVAVAELTVGLMVALDRRIPDNVIDLRNGVWAKKKYAKAGLGLKGKTLGVIGAGRIGLETAKRALAFDMEVLYYHLGRSRGLLDLPHTRRTELDELLKSADFVSLHVPGGDATKRLINAERLSLMKPDAFLINTARPDVVDEEALYNALKENRIRGAASDVFQNEPPPDGKEFTNKIRELPNFYGTHHIGASTLEAQLAVAAETARIVQHYKQTGEYLNCVNLATPKEKVMLVVRLQNKPGGLAAVFHELAAEEINVEEMDHILYDGGKAACAHIRINKSPSDGMLKRLPDSHPQVMGVELMAVE